jgi:hypothetical protein
MDYVHILPLSDRLREPLRAALAGSGAVWPLDLTEDELQAMVQHGVAPMAYAAGPAPQLRMEALRAAAVEPLRLADLRTVLQALDARGVTALVLKGTALAYDLYPEPELRPRGDTDLLIPAEARETVREALTAIGYTERLTSGDEHGVRQAAFTRVDSFGLEHIYDVHWSIANSAVFAEVLTFDELRQQARPLPRIAPNALGLPDVEALLLACVHRVAHHHDSDRLVWLFDIALLRGRLSREEHERFWRLAAERDVLGVCRHSVALADSWSVREPHDGAEEFLSGTELARDEPSRAFLAEEMTQGELLRADLKALSWPARLRRLQQLAFPPAAFLQQSFGVRSRLLLPWLYVYRGARGVGRLFRRVGAPR